MKIGSRTNKERSSFDSLDPEIFFYLGLCRRKFLKARKGLQEADLVGPSIKRTAYVELDPEPKRLVVGGGKEKRPIGPGLDINLIKDVETQSESFSQTVVSEVIMPRAGFETESSNNV